MAGRVALRAKSRERNDKPDRRLSHGSRNGPCSRRCDGLAAVTAGPGHDAFPDIHVISH